MKAILTEEILSGYLQMSQTSNKFALACLKSREIMKIREIIRNERFTKEICKVCQNFATRVRGNFDLYEIEIFSCFLDFKQ